MDFDTWERLYYPGRWADRQLRRCALIEDRSEEIRRRWAEEKADRQYVMHVHAEYMRRLKSSAAAGADIAAGMAEAGRRAAVEAPLRARIAELEAALEDREHG